MPVGLYLTHPQVAIDPQIPVPQWALSAEGQTRTLLFAKEPMLARVGRIVSSDERKAVETAEILAEALSLKVEIRPDLHENDRSATGFLPSAEFEATADRFFAEPGDSIRGWETASDAQARIVRAVTRALGERPDIDTTLLVGHGGVGALLMAHCARRGITRRYDQPSGGGNWFLFDAARLELLREWHPMEPDPPLPWHIPG